MNRMVVAVLVVGAVAAGVYLGDQTRVNEARATLQNRVSVVATEARDSLEHSAALTLHVTCGAGDEAQVRSVDVELQASQVTKARLMSYVPSECKLNNVQVNAVHLVGSQSQEVSLESPQFRNGTAQVSVAQTTSGVEITATGTASAGWFGRKIEATSKLVVDDAQQRRDVIERVVAALSGTGTQVAVTAPNKDETKNESQQAAQEEKKESEGETSSTAAESAASKSRTTVSATSSSSSRPSAVTVPVSSSEPVSSSASSESAVQPQAEPEPEPEPEPAAELEESAGTESESTQWQGTTEDLLREVCRGGSSRSWPAMAGIDLLCSNMANGENP